MKITTDDCKAHLVAHFEQQGSPTKSSEWKRGVKRKEGSDVVREFDHPTLGNYAVIERDGQLLPPESMDQERVQFLAARALVNRILQDDEGYGMIVGEALADPKMSPKAIAQQFVFGISGPLYESLGAGRMIAIITPKAYWEKERCWYDQEIDLDSLLPEGSEDLNGCGTWSIPMPTRDPVALRDELVNRGFVWDRAFQASVIEMPADDAEECDLSMLMGDKKKPPRP